MRNSESRIRQLEEALEASQRGERWVMAVLGVAQAQRDALRKACETITGTTELEAEQLAAAVLAKFGST